MPIMFVHDRIKVISMFDVYELLYFSYKVPFYNENDLRCDSDGSLLIFNALFQAISHSGYLKRLLVK